ncbi:MAG: TlpA family protein disulfide reductase [Candidatus Sungbacteria bacterium]|nr:TlpA family protein disulfide reductase [Candidatus Sungbacteria bacterium]
MNRKLLAINALIIVALAAALFGFTLYYRASRPESERVPSFPLKKFDGTVLALEDLRGQPVVLNFWAAWCVFCRDEMPIMETIHRAYRGRGLIVLGVHRTSTEDISVGEEFAKSIGVTYDLIQDTNDRLFNYFGGGAPTVPITVFIDRDGFVREKIIGPRSETQFRKFVEEILE